MTPIALGANPVTHAEHPAVEEFEMGGDPSALRHRLSVATHLAPAVLPVYAMAARRIGEQLERPAQLVVPTDYVRCGADLDDVCFVCSVPYVLLARRAAIEMDVIAAPVLRGERYGGRTVYFSDVIVRRDAPTRRFEDLAGSRWAYNEPFSHSGFLVVLHHLAEIGATAAFIGEPIEAGYHDDAIRLVLDGRADWAAIDSQVLDIWRRQRPSIDRQLRVIATLGPSTIQPVVASATRLSLRERRAAADALVDLADDPLARPLLDAAGIDRFVPATDADYADIRRMFDRVEGAGLLPSGWWARWEAEVGPGLSRRSPERGPAPPARSAPRPRPRRSSLRPSRPRS
ncbi:MAG TPA: PhnD/SsuA/transferrin family substrate-binding protein [Candidatus Limnocylindria bacterium]